MLEENSGAPTWITVAMAAIAALGGGVVARGYKGWRRVKTDSEADKRSDDDERRGNRAEAAAEKVSDKIVSDLTAQIDRLNKELHDSGELRRRLENDLTNERTEKFKLVRRLALLGRRGDITDIGLLPGGEE